MAISDLIMKMAVATSPKDRTDWTTAMAAEFAALKTGRVNWALGCFLTTIVWRLRAESLYLLVVMTTVVVAVPVLSILFDLVWMNILPRHPTGFVRLASYVLAWVPTLLLSFILGLWRPDRPLKTGVLALLASIADAYLTFHFVMHADFGYIHFMDLPPIAGELAALGYFLGGAWLGAAAHKAFMPRRQVV